MLTDYERAWGLLRDALVEKRSHGRQELLLAMAQIEQQCRLEKGAREQFARLYADDLLGAFRNVTPAAEPPLTTEAPDTGRHGAMHATPHLPETTGDADEHHRHHRAGRRAEPLVT